jgi:hypothetical protein
LGVKVDFYNHGSMETSVHTYPDGTEWYFDPDEHGTVRILKNTENAEHIRDEVALAEYSRHTVVRVYLYEEPSHTGIDHVKPVVNELYEDEEDDDV